MADDRNDGKDTAKERLLQISIAAHEYARSKTNVLTSLLQTPPAVGDEQQSLPSERTPQVDGPSQQIYETRLYRRPSESAPPYGSAFEKDLARIVHSPSFRRLQGKSQLIPAGENYFFRTRLTHSIEVAEIAKRIAMKINHEGWLSPYKVDHDLVSCAALLHDIGHPPFGHSGEEVLNRKMRKYGGFEGNAQTLRLVTRLENRLGHRGSVQAVYNEPRGLNLTVGTLASILKYDRKRTSPEYDRHGNLLVMKGYYDEETETVEDIRARLGVKPDQKLNTIECQIMDIADDIAYSAYDLEDTMEAGIISPFDFISVYDDTLEKITEYVNAQLEKRKFERVEKRDVLIELSNVFETILQYADPHGYDMSIVEDRQVFVGRSYNESMLHAHNSLIRRQFLETLIEENVRGVTAELNPDQPFLSTIVIDRDRLMRIECMKAFNFHKVIASHKLQIPHHRSAKIISSLFDALKRDREGRLLTDVERMQLGQCQSDKQRMRLICDIIASRTDSEAIHLFNRLNGFGNGSVFDYSN